MASNVREAVLKVMWIGRREVNFNDLKHLARIVAKRALGFFGIRFGSRASNKGGSQPPNVFTQFEKGVKRCGDEPSPPLANEGMFAQFEKVQR